MAEKKINRFQDTHAARVFRVSGESEVPRAHLLTKTRLAVSLRHKHCMLKIS